MKIRRSALVLILFALVNVLAVSCRRNPSESAGSVDTSAPARPPMSEEDARAFVEKFTRAMNSKDNLQLVRMTASDGKFLIATGAGTGTETMDSAKFLKWFQGLLKDAGNYSVEIKSMTYAGRPGGAEVTADLLQEVSTGFKKWSGRTKIKFTIEDRPDRGVVCTRMEGA